MDTRDSPPGIDAFARELPEVGVGPLVDEARAAAASVLAVGLGITADAPTVERARAAGVDVAGDIELLRATDARIAGITGTNGKSTVTSLLGEMLRAQGLEVAVGGNLGNLPRATRIGPARRLRPRTVELQLDLVSRLPLACAALLNLSRDHLDTAPWTPMRPPSAASIAIRGLPCSTPTMPAAGR